MREVLDFGSEMRSVLVWLSYAIYMSGALRASASGFADVLVRYGSCHIVFPVWALRCGCTTEIDPQRLLCKVCVSDNLISAL